jgi:streptomycin 6-kinase
MGDTATVVRVPDTVLSQARAAGAETWLEQIPALVAGLESDWSITVGRTYDGGSEALVVEATLDDGSPAVLKILVPGRGDAASYEATVLRLAGGEGCPDLFRFDPERGALLMERLGRPLHELGFPLARRLEILTDAAARVWRPAPGCGLPTGAEKARWLADFVVKMWEELDRPIPERTLAEARDAAGRRERAHREETAVLVHGDIHDMNALESGNGFALIDPDGLLAEPEYDLGVIIRGDPCELLVGDPLDRARTLARRTGLDPVAIWEWGVVERVSTGLLCTRIGLQPLGRDMLRAAEAVIGLSI